MAKIIFGCGYLGLRVAKRWLAADEAVYAVTRSPARARDLAELGLRPVLGDVTKSIDMPQLTSLSTVLFAVGFDRQAGYPIRQVYVAGLQRVLQIVPDQARRLIYISSTGVYGHAEGARVTEESPPKPIRPGGQACLEAEAALTAHPLGRRAVILRLAGIYGPGRIPKWSEVKLGRPLDALPAAILNLIHVDDAAEAVLAAERLETTPRLFNISDGCPVTRSDFYSFLADCSGAPPPQFKEGDPARLDSRGNSDKRVSNHRMLEELDFSLRFPDFRRGLAAVVEAAGNS